MRIKSAISIAALLTLPLASAAEAQDLVIVSWGGLVNETYRETMWDPFTEKTGIEIQDDAFNGELGTIRSQVLSGNVRWDIAEPEGPEAVLGCQEGLFAPIDVARHDTENVLEGTIDKCSIVALYFSTVLTYDGNELADGPTSWADFWNVEKFPGKRGMPTQVTRVLPIALLADGVSRENLYKVLGTKEGQDRAFEKLNELKPHIVWWSSGSEVTQALLADEFDMAVSWNLRASDANKVEGESFPIVWEAGHLLGTNRWVILKGAPHEEAAQKFLAYATQPEPQARYMARLDNSMINKNAYDLLEEERLQNLPTASEQRKYAVSPHVEFWLEHLDSLNERFNRMIAQ